MPVHSMLGDFLVHAIQTIPFNSVSNKIERVIFNNPATIVFWSDGTKTVVKANNEPFDKEKGLAMAICKKVYGNKGNFNNVFKQYCGD